MTDDQLIVQFQMVEDNLNQVLVSNNIYAIAKYISEDWVLLEPQYGIISKDRFLRVIELGELSHGNEKKGFTGKAL